MRLPSRFSSECGASPVAFTLIEVMIAITIFFMAMFTILGVLSSSLHAASILRNSGPTAGMVAAQLTLTNKLQEGSSSGNFSDIPIYEGYRWTSQTSEAVSYTHLTLPTIYSV